MSLPNRVNINAALAGIVLRHGTPIGLSAGVASFATALFADPLGLPTALALGGLTFAAALLAFGEGYLEGIKAGVTKFRPWGNGKGKGNG